MKRVRAEHHRMLANGWCTRPAETPGAASCCGRATRRWRRRVGGLWTAPPRSPPSYWPHRVRRRRDRTAGTGRDGRTWRPRRVSTEHSPRSPGASEAPGDGRHIPNMLDRMGGIIADTDRRIFASARSADSLKRRGSVAFPWFGDHRSAGDVKRCRAPLIDSSGTHSGRPPGELFGQVDMDCLVSLLRNRPANENMILILDQSGQGHDALVRSRNGTSRAESPIPVF